MQIFIECVAQLYSLEAFYGKSKEKDGFCFFTEHAGLKSYEIARKEVKTIPSKDDAVSFGTGGTGMNRRDKVKCEA